MAEDPLCTHTPGRFAGSPLLAIVRRAARRRLGGSAELGGVRGPRPWSTAGRRGPCVGRCGGRAHEEGPRVRPGDGGEGGRGFVPQERHRSRHGRRVGEDPRADADTENVRPDRGRRQESLVRLSLERVLDLWGFGVMGFWGFGVLAFCPEISNLKTSKLQNFKTFKTSRPQNYRPRFSAAW